MYDIRKFRQERGVTQAELAKNIGVSRSTIAKYENGERTPPLSTLQKIADYLKIPISEFGIKIPGGIKIVSPDEMFKDTIFGDIFLTNSKPNNNSLNNSFDIEEEGLNELQIKNMLIDVITVLFNQNSIYPSFEELNSLEEEIREYILFKAYLINKEKNNP